MANGWVRLSSALTRPFTPTRLDVALGTLSGSRGKCPYLLGVRQGRFRMPHRGTSCQAGRRRRT